MKSGEEKGLKYNVIIIVLGVVLVAMLGYFGYTKLIQKDRENNDFRGHNANPPLKDDTKNHDYGEDGDTSDNSEKLEVQELKDIVYKTKDGKKILRILEKHYSIDSNNGDIYKAEYDGKKLVLEYENIDKYSLYYGDEEGVSSQCGEYYFVVNNQTKEITTSSNDDEVYGVKYIGNKYYFFKGSCANADMRVYDENLNKIADQFIIEDNQGYFYALKDNYLIKFNQNGKIEKKGNIKIDYNKQEGSFIDMPSVTKNNLYSLIMVNKVSYLYDFANNKKYELQDPYKASICTIENTECMSTKMELLNNKLFIKFSPTEDDESDIEIVDIFDIASSKFIRLGNYLITDDYDYSSDQKYEYFYIYDNEFVYKYDRSAKMIEKASFDIRELYENPYDFSVYAYNGNLYLLIKENNYLYLQNAFSKEKYEIIDLDKYDYFGTRNYHTGENYSVYTSKLEIVVQEKANKYDQNGKEKFIYYYFDTLTKKMEK